MYIFVTNYRATYATQIIYVMQLAHARPTMHHIRLVISNCNTDRPFFRAKMRIESSVGSEDD